MEDVVITEEIRKEYIHALYNLQSGSKDLMPLFISKYPKEYKLIMTMYRKRTELNNTIDVMKMLNEPIYWFTLTFNNDKNDNLVTSKRKDATRFLNRICSVYVMVEEYGEDNGRYHIHGFLCFKYGFGVLDFMQWHSREDIRELKTGIKKQVKYLTDYTSKSIPRIRRSRSLSALNTYYKKYKRLYKLFPSTFMQGFNKQVANVVNPF